MTRLKLQNTILRCQENQIFIRTSENGQSLASKYNFELSEHLFFHQDVRKWPEAKIWPFSSVCQKNSGQTYQNSAMRLNPDIFRHQGEKTVN